MNKTKFIISRQTFLFVFFSLLFFSADTFFARAFQCGKDLGIFCPVTAHTDLTKFIIITIQYLFSVIALLCLLFMIIGGIKYIISAGNEQSITSAKNSITSAAYGLIIALMAYSILLIINTILNQ